MPTEAVVETRLAAEGVACTIVVATRNRCERACSTIESLLALSDAVPIIVVDDASGDGTSSIIGARFPSVRVVRLEERRGASARNVGVEHARTPYVAFCDDDEVWVEGSLSRAAALLDAYPSLALVHARLCVGDATVVDPAISEMAASAERSRSAYPWPTIASFFAGSIVVRRSAYLAAGGYCERFLIGAEEPLLALDLMEAGWDLGFSPELVQIHDAAGEGRDRPERRRLCIRNRLWTEWLRMPLVDAFRTTCVVALGAIRDPVARAALLESLTGIPWVLGRRRRVSRDVARRFRIVRFSL